MSEIECELTAYSNEQKKIDAIGALFENIHAGNCKTATDILAQLKIKNEIDFNDIFVEDINYYKKRIRVQYLTSKYSDAGKIIAKYLGLISDALLFSYLDNSMMLQEFYGFIRGRKRKISTMIKELINFDPDIALYEAANRGRIKDVAELLSKGSNPNACYGMPLTIMCIYNKRLRILEALLKAGANPNQFIKETGDTM